MEHDFLGGRFLTEKELAGAGFARLGKNVCIHSRASLYGFHNISIGDNVRIDDFAILIATGPIEIGNHVHIPAYCYLVGRYGIVLKDFVSLAAGAQIYSATDDYSGASLTNSTVPEELRNGASGKVILERHVIVGAHSIILPGCTLGEGCAVGALSLIKEDLAPWGIYGGIPARFLKERKKDLLNKTSLISLPKKS